MSTNFYRLYGAPHIFLGESIFSWVHRLSQQQGLSIEKLFSLVGASAPDDLDFADLREGFMTLIGMCGLTAKDFQVVNAICRSARTERLLQWQIRKNPDGRPVTAFCPDCLNADRNPYYRIEWRFSFWEYCAEHESRLLVCCSKCQRDILLDRAILLSSSPAPSLAYCRLCSSRLAETSELLVGEIRDIKEKVSNQRAMMASILNGYCMIAPFKKKLTLYVMMRLQQFDLLLSAQESDFESEFDAGRMRELDRFLRKIQFQSSRTNLFCKGTHSGRNV